MLKSVAKLLSRPIAPAAELRKGLDEIDIPALEKAAEDLEAERQRLLARDAPDAEVDAIEDRIKAAYRAAEKGHAARKEIEQRLTEAEAREHLAGLAAMRKEATRLTEAAIAAMRKELPSAYATIRQVVRSIEEARSACAAVNITLPSDQHVQDPEHIRNASGLGDVELKRETVWLWSAKNSPQTPLRAEDQRRVVEKTADVGLLHDDRPYGPGITRPPGMECVRRQYTRIERRRPEPGRFLVAYADALKLPPIALDEPAGWTVPVHGRDVDGFNRELTTIETLDLLDTAATKPVRDERPIEVMFQLVAEPASRAA